jgi:hypothetical protein
MVHTRSTEETADNRRKTFGINHQPVDSRQQKADSRLQTADTEHKTADTRHKRQDSRQQQQDSRRQKPDKVCTPLAEAGTVVVRW